MNGVGAANRAFLRQGPIELSCDLPAVPVGLLTLSGPSEQLHAAHWPVRGDLAHIRLAGRCFVPHYAVPMPHVVTAPHATLHGQANVDADVLQELRLGDGFDVLDMSGGWCWGQVAGDGLVGYIQQHVLVVAAACRT